MKLKTKAEEMKIKIIDGTYEDCIKALGGKPIILDPKKTKSVLLRVPKRVQKLASSAKPVK